MGLEAATLIHELDPANPVGGADPKGQGDDHIRMLKNVLLNTLPNVEGVVTATHTQLNKTTLLDALTVALAIATYVPTLTNIGNATGLANGFHRYIRLSDLVIVAGSLSCNCNVGQATIGISLPVASNFSAANQAAGGGGAVGANIAPVHVGTEFSSNERILLNFVSSGVATYLISYIALYPVLS